MANITTIGLDSARRNTSARATHVIYDWLAGDRSPKTLVSFSTAGSEDRAPISESYTVKPASFAGGYGTYVTGSSARLLQICEDAKEEFIALARNERFEYGYTAPSERFLLQFAKDYPALVGDTMQRIYLEVPGDKVVALAVLNAVASMGYETVYPHGQTLALGALMNPAPEVKEAAIRVYETWGHVDGARILSEVDCPWDWLDSYRKQVIEDLSGAA